MFNKKITEKLKQHNIPVNEGITYLLTVYYKVLPLLIPQELMEDIAKIDIFTIKGNRLASHLHSVIWHIPLFENQETNFDWIEEYRALFKAVNKERAGTKKSCILRMQSFMDNNKDITKDDIFRATNAYIDSLSSPSYIISADYFIFKGAFTEKRSELEKWLEIIKEEQGESLGRNKAHNTIS